jgi:hypothetical protein
MYFVQQGVMCALCGLAIGELGAVLTPLPSSHGMYPERRLTASVRNVYAPPAIAVTKLLACEEIAWHLGILCGHFIGFMRLECAAEGFKPDDADALLHSRPLQQNRAPYLSSFRLLTTEYLPLHDYLEVVKLRLSSILVRNTRK